MILVLAMALLVLPGLRIVPETHRFVVVRLGRIHSILEPGLRFVLPAVDRVIRVDLNLALPDWQSMSEPELQAQLRKLALSGQLPKPIS